MRKETVVFSILFLLFALPVSAQDMLIDDNGNVGIGTMSPSSKLEVVGNADVEAVAGFGSGAGTGIYGENSSSGNYGLLGNDYYGVFGYSHGGYAGYFYGDTRVTGNLIVDGVLTGNGIADITEVNAGAGLTGGGTSGTVSIDVDFAGTGSAASVARSDHDHAADYSPLLHEHSGDDITGGTVLETFIDPIITRDHEIMPFVLANDGAGSGLDADTLDGKDSAAFADSVHTHSILETRIATLEAEEAKAFVVRSARAVSDKAYTAEPELEIWMRAVQKAHTSQGSLTELDTNGDGIIIIGWDLNNDQLATAGVVTTFIQSRLAMGQKSPWNSALPLWRDGGEMPSQQGCDQIAQASPGQISLCHFYGEDHLIQTLFISAADDAGNIIYHKYLHGHSGSERRGAMIETAKEAVPELQRWLAAVRKGGPNHPLSGLVEVDTNGDGAIIEGMDLNNVQLAAAGVVTAFVQSRLAMDQKSPWDGNLPLWRDGGEMPSQQGCDWIAKDSPGQISLCYFYGQDQMIRTLFISASDYWSIPDIVFNKALTAYSESELRAFVVDAAKEALPELGNWIKAVQKAGTLEGGIMELDTDGDGAVIVGMDLNNDHLAEAGVVTIFVQSRTNMGERSPWNSELPLWRNGGEAPSQESCDTMAQASPGQISLCHFYGQGNLIRTLFISAADYGPSPNIIYKKSVAGRSESERIDSTIRSAEEAVPELERWMRAVRKGQFPEGEGLLTEVDTNGDGAVIDMMDLNNFSLSASGLVNTFTMARHNMKYRSFWNGYDDLWISGLSVPGQEACNAFSSSLPGRIVLCFYPSEDFNVEAVFISASDMFDNVYYQRTVTGN